MSTLTGRKIANSYKNLLQVETSNTDLDTSLRSVQTGAGNSTPLQLSTDKINLTGTLQIDGTTLTAGAATLNAVADLTGATGLVAVSAGNIHGRSIAVGNPLTISNANGTEGNPTINLASSGVSAATYGPMVNFTVDNFGRITDVTVTTTISANAFVGGTISGSALTVENDTSIGGDVVIEGTTNMKVISATDVTFNNLTVNTKINAVTVTATTIETSILRATTISVTDLTADNINFENVSVSSLVANVASVGKFNGNMTIESTADGGPILTLVSNDPNDAGSFDNEAIISFKAENDADQQVEYAQIRMVTADETDGTEDGRLVVALQRGGSGVVNGYQLSSNILFLEHDDHIIRWNQTKNTSFNVNLNTATPSATRTITLPDATGTVLLDTGNQTLTGDLTLTGTLIADGVTLGDGELITFGTDSDATITHDGSNLIIDSNTGTTLYHAGQHQFKNQFGSETHALFSSNGAVSLYYDNELRFRTTLNGIDVLSTDDDGSSDNNANIRIIAEGTNEIVTLRSADGTAHYISRNGDNYGTHLFQGFGTVTPNTVNMLQLTSTGHTSYQDLTIQSTDDGATEDPSLILYRNSSSPADDDIIGEVIFRGKNDADEDVEYAQIRTDIADASNGSEDGRLDIFAMRGGTLTQFMAFNGGAGQTYSAFALNMQNNNINKVNTINFEGSTDDTNETTLAVVDPTADRTITFPDATGTVLVDDGSGNVAISGNLTVSGTTTTVNSSTLSVQDPLIILANNNNSSDVVDIGFYGLYDTSGSQDLYAGLFRDASDSGKFKLFKDLQAEPTTTVNTGGTGYAVGTLVANLEGTIQTATQTNITSLGTLTGLTIDGDTTFTGTSGNIVFDKSDNALEFADSTQIKFGSDFDAFLRHTGSNLELISSTGDIIIADTTGDVRIQGKYGENSIVANNDGSVELYHNNVKKFETTTQGFGYFTSDVGIEFSDQSNNGVVEIGGSAGALIDLKSPRTDDFDFRLQVNTSNTAFVISDDLHLQSRTGAEDYLDATVNGAVNLYYDNSLRFSTTSTGAKITGGTGDGTLIIEADTDNATEEDNALLQLTQDGGAVSVDFGFDASNNILIKGGGSAASLYLQSQGEFLARGIPNGAFELYYDNVKKFETTSTGATVTGTLISDVISIADGSSTQDRLTIGTNDDFFIYHDNQTVIANKTSSGPIKIQAKFGEQSIVANQDAGVQLYYNHAKVFETTSTGVTIEDPSDSQASKSLRIIGKRSDANDSFAFSGKLMLATNRTEQLLDTGKTIGIIGFGGNHTDGTVGNILYSSAITGVAEGDFNSATDMPSGLAFFTGSTGRDPDTPNVFINTERMRINKDGNVGIGKTSPAVPLDVAGQVRTTDGSVDLRMLPIDASNAGIVGTYSNDDLVFNANSSEVMRVKTSGNVGIGTTTPQQKLHVAYSYTNTNLTNQAGDGNNLTSGLRINNTSSTSDTYASIDLRANNADVRLASVNKGTNTSDFVVLVDKAGNTSLDEALRVTSTSDVIITNTDADADSDPSLILYRNSSSPADNDDIGEILFRGRNDNSQDVEYTQLVTDVTDVSDGTEDAQFLIKVMSGGTLTQFASFNGGGSQIYFSKLLNMQGNNIFGVGSQITFEGSTADDHETILAVTDPTADRTITLPDASGTVAITQSGTLSISKIAISATNDVSPTSTLHAFQLGPSNSTNIAMDNNEIMARNNGSVSNLKINDGVLEVGSSSTTFTGDVTIQSTDAGATAGPTLSLYRNSASPASADDIGQIQWFAENDADEKIEYARIDVRNSGVTDGAEYGQMDFMFKDNGSDVVALRLSFNLVQFYKDLYIGAPYKIRFEGSNYNDFETFLTVAGPTADRTITLPDASGTVVLQDSNGDATIGGGLTVTGGNSGDVLLTFATDRSWQFQQLNDNASTRLQLKSNVDSKLFDIVNSSDNVTHTFFTSSVNPTMTLTSYDADATEGPSLILNRDSASPAVNDLLGTIVFQGEDSVSSGTIYGKISGIITDPTNGSEDGLIRFQSLAGGTLYTAYQIGYSGNFFYLDVYLENAAKIHFGGATNDSNRTVLTVADPTAARIITLPDATGDVVLNESGTVNIRSTADNGPQLNIISNDHSDASDFSNEAFINFIADNDADQEVTYARIGNFVADVTDGTEDGRLRIDLINNGSMQGAIQLGSGYLFLVNDTHVIEWHQTRGTNFNIGLATATPTANRVMYLPDADGTVLTTGNSDTPATTTSSSDADFVLIDDGGTMKKITPSNLGIGSGGGGGSFNGTLTSTDAGETAAPILTLDRNSASPADGDFLGDVQFKGRNDAGEEIIYGSMGVKIEDMTDGTEDSRLIYKVQKAGELKPVLDIKADQFKINNVSEVLFGDPVSSLKFEGATGDAYELTLAITDPTADRTVTIPDASGTIALKSEYFQAFRSSDSAAFTGTFVTIDFDTVTLNSNNSVFVESAGEVTINKAGIFRFSADVTTKITSGGSRSDCEIELQLKHSGGSFSTLTGTTAITYNRTSGRGEQTASINFMVNITSGDAVRVVVKRQGGTDTIVVQGNASRFNIQEVN